MTPSETPIPEAFLDALREAAATVGWQFQATDGESMTFADGTGVQKSIGLARFFGRFRDHDPAEWPTRIADYLRTVIGITRQPPSDDLASRADKVVVRVGPPYPSTPPVSVWGRPLPETDLAVMLVLEEGPGLRFVRTDMVEASGRSGDDWVAVGLENLRRKTPAGSLRVVEPTTGLLACCVGDDHDGSRALLLPELLPEPAPHGVLASLPHRGVLLVLPLRRPVQQRGLALLQGFTQSQHAEASHPLSPHVFWVHEGIWRPFGIQLGEDGVRVQPPPEMAETLRDLLGP